MAHEHEMSPAEYERLKRRLEELEEARKRVAREIAEAAAQKDLSENAAYQAAKEKQALLEGEIARVMGTLRRARVVQSQATDGTVRVGSRVRLKHKATGQELELRVVANINHAAEGEPVVSAGSPLGRALLGRRAGEAVTAQTPQGPQHYEILEVRA